MVDLKSMSGSVYHILLRTSALTIALILLFDSGLLSPVTSQLSQDTQQYLAQAVGVKAQIKPTEINKLTAQITQRNTELDRREAALNEREIATGLDLSRPSSNSSSVSTYIFSVILFILLVLIVLNYSLDFIRERKIFIKKNYEQTT